MEASIATKHYQLQKENHLYKLDVTVLSRHGLNWMDFGGSVDDELMGLYKDYINYNKKQEGVICHYLQEKH